MYRLRFIFVMLKCLFSEKKELTDDFWLSFWAIPVFDTDLTLLFTQTYGQYMGLARWNLLFNSEFRKAALKRGWAPVTSKETIFYRRPIKMFSCVSLKTRIVYWNDRRFYLEQIFYVKNDIRAIAYVEGLIRGSKSHLNPHEAFKVMGVEKESPALPQDMKGWVDLVYEPHD